MSEKHDLVLDTPFGPFTLDGEQTQQFATTIKQKLNQIPYTDAADEGSQNYIETEMMETKVQEIFEKEYRLWVQPAYHFATATRHHVAYLDRQ